MDDTFPTAPHSIHLDRSPAPSSLSSHRRRGAPTSSSELDALDSLLGLAESALDSLLAGDPGDLLFDDLVDEHDDEVERLRTARPSAIPPSFACALTGQPMVEPVLLSDGHSYEREAAHKILARPAPMSPVTGEPLTNLEVCVAYVREFSQSPSVPPLQKIDQKANWLIADYLQSVFQKFLVV